MKNRKKSVIATGKWLSLDLIEYEDHNGTVRKWETVSRKQCEGAVLMIAKLVPSNRYILIRQYRPPVSGIVMEFPAGLIDPGEKPEAAAIRELREETGYIGTVDQIFPPAYNSPGLTGEFIRTVLMTVQEQKQPEHLNTDFDESEDIETLLIPEETFRETVLRELETERRVDAKVLTFALAMK